MAVKFISVKCPECGANLDIEEDRKTVYCSYCGRKILLHNENEHVYRYIDEAEIKQAEARLREVALAEKQYADAEKKLAEAKRKDALKLKVLLGLMAIGVILILLSLFIVRSAALLLWGIEVVFWPFLILICWIERKDKNERKRRKKFF